MLDVERRQHFAETFSPALLSCPSRRPEPDRHAMHDVGKVGEIDRKTSRAARQRTPCALDVDLPPAYDSRCPARRVRFIESGGRGGNAAPLPDRAGDRGVQSWRPCPRRLGVCGGFGLVELHGPRYRPPHRR
jgi:hypothetical protein